MDACKYIRKTLTTFQTPALKLEYPCKPIKIFSVQLQQQQKPCVKLFYLAGSISDVNEKSLFFLFFYFLPVGRIDSLVSVDRQIWQ